MKTLNFDVRRMCQLALLIALELLMGYTPLGYLQLGFIAASLLSIPVAVGAIVLGPIEGLILSLVFGLISFAKGFSSTGLMTQAMFSASIIGSFIVTVGGRILMGLSTGAIVLVLKKLLPKHDNFCCLIGSISAPLLNTFFYMSLLMLIFYNTEYIQGLSQATGLTNPFLLILSMVGVQALIETAICSVISFTVSKTLLLYLNVPFFCVSEYLLNSFQAFLLADSLFVQSHKAHA